MSLTPRFVDAVGFATAVHATQTRKGTSVPYVAHLLAVASLVLEHGGDEDDVVAALLHDAPEDQGGRPLLEAIRTRFGARVAAIVEGCTDSFESPKPPWRQRKEAYLAHLAVADAATCLVSAADKLHNARTILTDLRTSGDAVWSRFHGTPAELNWYYRSVAALLRRRLHGSAGMPLVAALECTLDAIWPGNAVAG